jgi:hypothetical protein
MIKEVAVDGSGKVRGEREAEWRGRSRMGRVGERGDGGAGAKSQLEAGSTGAQSVRRMIPSEKVS